MKTMINDEIAAFENVVVGDCGAADFVVGRGVGGGLDEFATAISSVVQMVLLVVAVSAVVVAAVAAVECLVKSYAVNTVPVVVTLIVDFVYTAAAVAAELADDAVKEVPKHSTVALMQAIDSVVT